jgi:hypothetical protein
MGKSDTRAQYGESVGAVNSDGNGTAPLRAPAFSDAVELPQRPTLAYILARPRGAS